MQVRQFRATAFVIALLGVAISEAAADTTRSFQDLKDLVLPGETLHVLDTNNQEWNGTLVEVSDSGIVLTVQGVRREIDRASVRHVEKDGDRLWNGALLGEVFGLLPSQGCSKAACAVAGIALWTGIGALVDKLHRGRTRIYEAHAAP